MAYVPLLAPFGVLAFFLLLGAGLYRSANQGGLIARKRLAAWAPTH